MQTLTVDLGDNSYPIHIGQSLLSQSELVAKHVTGSQVLIVTNTTIAPLYLETVLKLFHEFEVESVILPDGEQYKTLDTLNLIFDALLTFKFNRKVTLVALGGGVVGDMTGFAAASYQRGVNFIQIPTTLLSQVDSSVGGKTGVNHPLGKNMIGAFHQPSCVLIDVDTLDTLPDRELSAGLAEVVKYGLICDAPFYHWIEEHAEKMMARQKNVLIETIQRSCLNKAQVVAKDEKENDIRAILNLGHTFGHAIEAVQGYGNWLHGEAVATGMIMALELSVRENLIDRQLLDSLIVVLEKWSLPIKPPLEMSVDDFLNKMMVDKKVLDKALRLVLLQGLGDAIVTDAFSEQNLRDTLEIKPLK